MAGAYTADMSEPTWFTDPLRALTDARIEYVVVGGLATIAHGYVRTTQDVDVVIRLEPANVRAAMAALESAGYRPKVPVLAADFADPEKRRSWIEEKRMVVFSMAHDRPGRPTLDVFTEHPLPWEQLRGGAEMLDVGSTVAPVCSLDDLILMKREAGRAKDLIDLGQLETIRDAAADATRFAAGGSAGEPTPATEEHR